MLENENVKEKTNKKIISKIVKTLAAVHTHTHTHGVLSFSK